MNRTTMLIDTQNSDYHYLNRQQEELISRNNVPNSRKLTNMISTARDQYKRSDRSKKPLRIMINFSRHQNHLLIVTLALAGLIQLLISQQQLSLVVCQDFEDLNSSTNKHIVAGGSNNQQRQQVPQHTFQLQNSRQQHAAPSQQATVSSKPQRPLLSNRFAPPQSSGLSVQASTNNAVFSVSPAPQQQQQQQQQVAQPAAQPATSNIEQLMKNALARTARMNSEAERSEARSDNGQEVAAPQPVSAPIRIPKPALAAIVAEPKQEPLVAAPAQSSQATQFTDKQAESSETSASTEALSSDDPRQTTIADPSSTNSHETVYSDSRFGRLFARRNNLKKSKIQPTEQIKAKPTLPSFIKSPPDPKQFAATQAAASQQEQTRTPANSFASQRVPGLNNQNRNIANNNLLNQQKNKAAITSTSAANASNKRANSLNNANKQQSSSSKPLTSSVSNPKAAAAVVKPTSNNPFNRSQAGNSNSEANVIAMARKRLLANNALESAKLKQQKAIGAAVTTSSTLTA